MYNFNILWRSLDQTRGGDFLRPKIERAYTQTRMVQLVLVFVRFSHFLCWDLVRCDTFFLGFIA